MNTRTLPHALAEEAHKALEACKGNQTKAAKQLGISRTTLQSRLDRYNSGRTTKVDTPTRESMLAQCVGLLAEHPDLSSMTYQRLAKDALVYRRWWNSWSEFAAEARQAAGVDDILSIRERRRFQDKIELLSKELRNAHRELNEREDYRASLFGMVSEPVRVPGWALLDARPSNDAELPILHASDWQIGEVITAERTGFNAFSKDVAEERIKLLVEKTIELSFQHRGKKRYPGIHYWRGGDMISGEIHDDLSETNDLTASQATRWLVERETWVIRELRKAFGKVHVITVNGNHDRTTYKPRSKADHDNSFSGMSHYWLESKFENDISVTFDAPTTGDAVMDIYGYKLCLTHGDRIGSRGGQGYIGAVATITRGMKKLFEYYATLGHVIDYSFVGHFHVALALEYGYANGSLPGYSEYAKDFRMRPHPPCQNLYYIHPRYGVNDYKQIILADRPKLSLLSNELIAA